MKTWSNSSIEMWSQSSKTTVFNQCSELSKSQQSFYQRMCTSLIYQTQYTLVQGNSVFTISISNGPLKLVYIEACMLIIVLRFSNFLMFFTRSSVANPSFIRKRTFLGLEVSIVFFNTSRTSYEFIAPVLSVDLSKAV